MKTCPCGHAGGLADFDFCDALCRSCRAEKGPRKREKRAPLNGQRAVLLLPDKPKPKPTGRRATPQTGPHRNGKPSSRRGVALA